MLRISQAAKKLNVGIATIADFLAQKGYEIDSKPNTKIDQEQYALLEKEFADSMAEKQEAAEMSIGIASQRAQAHKEESPAPQAEPPVRSSEPKSAPEQRASREERKPEVAKSEKPTKQEPPKEPEKIRAGPQGLKVVGKIDLTPKPKAKSKPAQEAKSEPTVAKAPAEEAKPQPEEQQPQPEAEKAKPKAAQPEQPKAATPQQPEPTPAPPAQPQADNTQKPTEQPEQPKAAQAPKPEVAKSEAESKAETKPEPTPKAEDKPEPTPEPKAKEEEKAAPPREETPQTEAAPQTPAKPAQPQAEKPAEPKARPAKAAQPSSGSKPKATAESQDKSQAPPKADQATRQEAEATQAGANQDDATIAAKADKLQGLKVVGKIELPTEKPKKKAGAGSDNREGRGKRRKRVRIKREAPGGSTPAPQPGSGVASAGRADAKKGAAANATNKKGKKKKGKGEAVSAKDVQEQYKKTLSELSGGKGVSRGKRDYKKKKREAIRGALERQRMEEEEASSILKVTEFISTNEMANMMDINVNEIIKFCFSIGMSLAINTRLDAEQILMIADEFGYKVDFVSAEDEAKAEVEVEEDPEDKLQSRAPIITIMGHVDHGKTSLLDYIRNTKVASGEAGGITQHIGAYDVTTESGRRLAFLDTPGHEAFTAMRARGAKVTDVAIIVIAADDNIMPQTEEAINHVQNAGVPFVIAINKVDKPNANPHAIKEQLANRNLLIEEWGGKIQSQEISAKTGQGVEDLLELVLLEADILELKANPDRRALGTVVEASLDKGRGFIATILVQNGTLRVGDIMLAGSHYGRVKAMIDHLGNRIKEAQPSTPVQVLGLDGAPQAGDKMVVMETEREAREIATKRSQIQREQSIRATKRTSLSDIGRRIAIGNFQQLNIVLKGDVDGSVEALSDSLLKNSTEEIEVNIVHKGVGPISESDILLASASDAVVIGFQVRPTSFAKKLAEQESVEVRLYSVIYDAINDVRDAMEGMLAPDYEEEIVGNVEVRDVFKITKVGTVAGCYVTEGYIKRSSKIRIIRDGIVIYGGENGGEILALKRFKDDVSEVKQGFECGLSIKNYNDIQIGDVVEAYELKEVKRTLAAV